MQIATITIEAIKESLKSGVFYFHNTQRFADLMQSHKAFKGSDETYYIRDSQEIIILKVFYTHETSMFPQSSQNEITKVISYYIINETDLLSALQCFGLTRPVR